MPGKVWPPAHQLLRAGAEGTLPSSPSCLRTFQRKAELARKMRGPTNSPRSMFKVLWGGDGGHGQLAGSNWQKDPTRKRARSRLYVHKTLACCSCSDSPHLTSRQRKPKPGKARIDLRLRPLHPEGAGDCCSSRKAALELTWRQLFPEGAAAAAASLACAPLNRWDTPLPQRGHWRVRWGDRHWRRDHHRPAVSGRGLAKPPMEQEHPGKLGSLFRKKAVSRASLASVHVPWRLEGYI